MDTPSLQTREKRRILLWIYGLVLLYYILKQVYYAVWVGGFPDQLAHLTYLSYLSDHPTLFPDFRSIPYGEVLGEQNGIVSLRLTSWTVNNMIHPPLYYLILNLFSGIRAMGDGTYGLDIMRLRFLNIALSSGTAVLAFRLGYTRLHKGRPLLHLLYALAIATLPMFSYVGASVNNDNLSYFAMVIFFTGLLRYSEGKEDLKTYLLVGIGFLLGSFSKLTTALLCLIMLGVTFIMSVIRTRSLKLILNRYFLITLPCYLLFLAYEIHVKRTCGAWQPSLLDLDPEYYYTTIFYVRPEDRVAMTLPQYVRQFIEGIGYSWSSLYCHNAEVTRIMKNMAWGIIYWIPVGASVFAAARSLVRRDGDRLALPVVLGFLGTLGYHFYSNWKGYAVSGYLGALQARYYLGMIVPFAFLMCSRVFPLFEKKKVLTGIVAGILIAGWIAGDAVRLLIFYGFPAGLR